MADNEVKSTDKTGESKDTESLKLSDLFGTPEVETPTEKSGESKDTKPTPSPGESVDEDPKELQAKLEALTKELTRVRKGKTESGAEVQVVREQLANLQGQLDTLLKTKSPDTTGEDRLTKYTDEQLLQGQTEWEDELYEQRDAQRRARTENDDVAYTKAARNLGVAKSTLVSIRKELLERTKRVGAEQAKTQSETSELVQEITGLYENAYEALPDLKDKDSELWQAGNEIFNRHPKLMKQLGPLAELVATALALSEKPSLVPGGGTTKVKEARKELLTEINAQAEKSLLKGKGAPNKKSVPDFGAMPRNQFEKMIHDLKMGGS